MKSTIKPFYQSLFIIGVFLIAGSLEPAEAQTRKKKKTILDRSAVSCEDVTFGKNDKSQEVCCNGDKAGIARARGEDQIIWTSLKQKNRLAKQKALARGRKAPAKWRQVIKASKGLCPIDGEETPTPTPENGGGGSTARHWDDNGEMNSVGKECFKIPESLSANVLTGIETWNKHCDGCHGSSQGGQIDRSFTDLRERIAQSPMFILEDEVDDEDLANITAYLARFSPDDCPVS